jgi:hypothetical protein
MRALRSGKRCCRGGGRGLGEGGASACCWRWLGVVVRCGVHCRLAIYTAPLSRTHAGGTVRFGRRRGPSSAAALRACQRPFPPDERVLRVRSACCAPTQPAQTLSPCPEPSSAAAAPLSTPGHGLADALRRCLPESTARRTRPSTSRARITPGLHLPLHTAANVRSIFHWTSHEAHRSGAAS